MTLEMITRIMPDFTIKLKNVIFMTIFVTNRYITVSLANALPAIVVLFFPDNNCNNSQKYF